MKWALDRNLEFSWKQLYFCDAVKMQSFDSFLFFTVATNSLMDATITKDRLDEGTLLVITAVRWLAPYLIKKLFFCIVHLLPELSDIFRLSHQIEAVSGFLTNGRLMRAPEWRRLSKKRRSLYRIHPKGLEDHFPRDKIFVSFRIYFVPTPCNLLKFYGIWRLIISTFFQFTNAWIFHSLVA